MAIFSDKVIKHLRFAKNWLDRAEEEFSNEQILEAELTLSLAEAEVRHAWETSRGSEVSATLRVMHRWRRRIVIGLILGALGWGGFVAFSNRGPDYPSPGFSLGQPIVPGRWDNRMQYQIVLNSQEPQVRPAEPKQPDISEVQELPPEDLLLQAEVDHPARPVIEELVMENQPVDDVPIVPVDDGSVPVVEVAPPQIVVERTPEPAQPAKVEEIVPDPPQLNLGELFKIANDALKGE